MKPTHSSTAALKRIEALLHELESQSDRGVAIVGAAWVEESLERSLHTVLETHPASWKRLFEKSAPLATFSAKIDLSRLVGTVSDAIHSDLHIVREIRNAFAHDITHKITHETLTFSSPNLKDKCFALRCIAHESHATAREAFIGACSNLSASFGSFAIQRLAVGNTFRVSAKGENAA